MTPFTVSIIVNLKAYLFQAYLALTAQQSEPVDKEQSRRSDKVNLYIITKYTNNVLSLNQ